MSFISSEQGITAQHDHINEEAVLRSTCSVHLPPPTTWLNPSPSFTQVHICTCLPPHTMLHRPEIHKHSFLIATKWCKGRFVVAWLLISPLLNVNFSENVGHQTSEKGFAEKTPTRRTNGVGQTESSTSVQCHKTRPTESFPFPDKILLQIVSWKAVDVQANFLKSFATFGRYPFDKKFSRVTPFEKIKADAQQQADIWEKSMGIWM